MKAPEKIYFSSTEDGTHYYTERVPFERECIEYIRTDACIEKACDWLESVNLDFYQIREGVFSKQLVEDFKKYMKGE
jgi:hypothetical protein